MKKIILLVLSLASVFAVSRLVQNRAEAEEANDVVAEELNALFTSYRNNGYYTKHTVINVDTNNEALVKDIENYFHASVNHTERTTYYYNDTLWMSQDKEGDEVGYVVYGTSYDAQGQANGVTRGVVSKRFEHPTDAKVVLSGEGKNSMDQYYVTLTDMVVTADQGWTLDGGVYTTTNEAVIENYINFTAPLWLTTEEASNYVDYTKATAQVVDGKLVMKLWVSTTELEGKLVEGAEVVGNDAVFSTATVSGLPGALAIYTFDNGEIVNTGTDQTIIAEAVKNADLTSVAYSNLVLATGADGSANSALKLAHHASRFSFRLRGIDTGAGDFTVSVKVYQETKFAKTTADHYLFGTSVSNITDAEWNPNESSAPGKDPIAPLFSVAICLDSSSAGYIRNRIRFNGEATKYIGGTTKDVAGYFTSKTWVEYRIVKIGTTLIVSNHFNDTDSIAKTCPSSYTYTLTSYEAAMITPEMLLGFGYNYGAKTPGNDSIYDDIYVWDYAVPEFLN